MILSDLSNLAVHRRNIYSCKRIITETWQMRFHSKKCHCRGHSKKCHTLSISRQRNKSSPVYYLGTDLPSTVSSHTYLGITVSSDLKWHEHISNICVKATRTLNFVRRNTYCCYQEAKNLAYLSLVRPQWSMTLQRRIHGQRYPATRTSSMSCCLLAFSQKRLSLYNFCHWSARRTWLVALVRTSQTLSFDGFLQSV